MSAIAGILRMDYRERVGEEDLRQLDESISFLGPDGGSHARLGVVGLAHRSLATLSGSPQTPQPLRRDDAWIVWDGRLDNREELTALLAIDSADRESDADLVLMAYRRWGLNAFERLEGDFALSLWDGGLQRLLLVRDPMGIRPLFLRRDPKQYVWCTVIEPLVLQAGRPLSLNHEHIHKLFSGVPCLDSTCYREIFAIPPGTIVVLQSQAAPLRTTYWKLPARQTIRYKSDEEYEEQFRALLIRSVDCCLRSNGPITAELSGGLDSSTVVCIADHIREKDGQRLVETISYFDTAEPSGDERGYIKLIEQQRGMHGHHIALAELRRIHADSSLEPLRDPFQGSPGRFEHNVKWLEIAHKTQRNIGSRVVLSGIGGDEFFGGVPYGAPEIADHLCSYHFIRSSKALLDWSISRQQTARQSWKEVLELLRARRSPESMLKSSISPLPWLRPQLNEDATAFRKFANWESLTPNELTHEWLRCKLTGQFTIAGSPLFGDIETRYPILNRSLFSFLAAIPRDQVVRAGERRRLQRKALRGIVPDAVLDRTTKWFGLRSAHDLLRSERTKEFFAQPWIAGDFIFDMNLLRGAHAIVNAGNPGQALPLQMAIAFEQWLRNQVTQGTISMSASRLT